MANELARIESLTGHKLHHVNLKWSDVLMSWYLSHILSLFVVIFLQLSCSRADDRSFNKANCKR